MTTDTFSDYATGLESLSARDLVIEYESKVEEFAHSVKGKDYEYVRLARREVVRRLQGTPPVTDSTQRSYR